MQSMKLSSRIRLGFGALIVILLALNAVSIYLAAPVRHSSEVMQDEALPLITDIGAFTMGLGQSIYQVRGFAYNEEDRFMAEAKKYHAAIREAFGRMRDVIDQKAGFAVLRPALPEASRLIDALAANYDALENIGHGIVGSRGRMDELTKTYVSQVLDFQKFQEGRARDELVDHGFAIDSTAEKREYRLSRLLVTSELLHLGALIQLDVWEAYGKHEVSYTDRLDKNLKTIEDSVKKDLDSAVDEEARKILGALAATVGELKKEAATYKKALTDWSANMAERVQLVAAIVGSNQMALNAILKTADDISNANVTAVARITQAQIIGGLVALV